MRNLVHAQTAFIEYDAAVGVWDDLRVVHDCTRKYVSWG